MTHYNTPEHLADILTLIAGIKPTTKIYQHHNVDEKNSKIITKYDVIQLLKEEFFKQEIYISAGKLSNREYFHDIELNNCVISMTTTYPIFEEYEEPIW